MKNSKVIQSLKANLLLLGENESVLTLIRFENKFDQMHEALKLIIEDDKVYDYLNTDYRKIVLSLLKELEQ